MSFTLHDLTYGAYQGMLVLSTSGRAFSSFMASKRYVRIWDKELGKATRVHRVAAEQALGRPLEPGEVVHHINGDRSDKELDFWRGSKNITDWLESVLSSRPGKKSRTGPSFKQLLVTFDP